MFLYVHTWSVNIILLLFILSAIGYILSEDPDKKIICEISSDQIK